MFRVPKKTAVGPVANLCDLFPGRSEPEDSYADQQDMLALPKKAARAEDVAGPQTQLFLQCSWMMHGAFTLIPMSVNMNLSQQRILVCCATRSSIPAVATCKLLLLYAAASCLIGVRKHCCVWVCVLKPKYYESLNTQNVVWYRCWMERSFAESDKHTTTAGQ